MATDRLLAPRKSAFLESDMEELDGNGVETKATDQVGSPGEEMDIDTPEECDLADTPRMDAPEENTVPLELSSISASSDRGADAATSQCSGDDNLESSNVSAENGCKKGDVNHSTEDPHADDSTVAIDTTPVNTKDISGNLEEVEGSSEQQPHLSESSQSIMSDKEESNKDVIEKDADEEVDRLFQQSSAPTKKFPGLDNVDLASDEEGQDALDDHEGDSDRKIVVQKGDQANGEAPLIPPFVTLGLAGLESANQDEPCYCSEDEELSKLACAHKSPLKDYPINVGNYKVCRQVEPGVKECIVLETGEQIKCFDKSKSPTLSLSSNSIIQTEPQSTSSPRVDLTAAKIESQRNTQQQQQSVSSSNVSENFEYQSFPDGSASTIIAAAESNLNDVDDDADVAGGMEQQVFITESGIPVILDNAEDDVKINIQAEMDRVSKAIQSLQRSGAELVSGTNAELAAPSKETEDLVGDVLSSGENGEGGGSQQIDGNLMPVKKSKRKRDKERYYVLQPDKVNSSDIESESNGFEVNQNNNSNINDNNNAGGNSPVRETEDMREQERETDDSRRPFDLDDVNNSSSRGNRHRLSAADFSGADATRTRSPQSHYSYYDDIPSWAKTRRGDGLSDRYSSSVLKGSSLNDSSRYLPSRSHLNSRYDDSASSLEASRISTRYSLLDRGQHNSSPSSGTKQVSWHDMFKMIEEQHRSQQQQQYLEHQRILQEMQQSMKKELSKQQDTLKDRLNKYNELLEELSVGRREGEQDTEPYMMSSGQEDDGIYREASRTTLDGVPISLRYPPPLSGPTHPSVHESDCYEESLYDRTPTKRCLEQEMKSPPRSADSSLNASQASFGEDKQLRGGVYSSPVPLAKAKHKGSPKSSKSYPKGSSSHLSPRDKDREEMAASRHTPPQNFSLNAATLTSENTELRQRCQDLADACHDRKIEIRELTQKIQGLERRATDCTNRYETSQSQVIILHNRLEELTEYAKERDCSAAEMEIKAKQSAESLQSAHKREKELTDSLQAAKVTIRKLVEKYEMMEKDHELLKDSYKDQEHSLLLTRKEVRELNSKLSKMDLENKQLVHEKDVLKHDLTMARSSPTKTTFEEAIQSMPTNRRRSPLSKRGPMDNKSLDRAYRGSSQERPGRVQEFSPPDSEYSDNQQSPIMKAEMELQKLRESMANGKDFAPRLQRKFYGTDVPRPSSSGGFRGSSVPASNRHPGKTEVSLQAPKSSSPRDTNKGFQSQTSNTGRRSCPAGIANVRKNINGLTNGTGHSIRVKNAENGMTGDQAIERVKTGEIISRPAWEDMYTSMAPAGKGSHGGGKGPSKKHEVDVSNAMRDLSLKERLQSIENLERKYDDLISDKSKFESALSRIRPGQSHRREKERLETELDRVDRELGSIRMSLKRFHVLKSSI